jgi:hypothetical protein
MAISIWFIKKTSGLPDQSMPARYVEDVNEAVAMVEAHKAGQHGNEHYLRISAPGGELSPSDCDRLRLVGAEATDLFLPDVASPRQT